MSPFPTRNSAASAPPPPKVSPELESAATLLESSPEFRVLRNLPEPVYLARKGLWKRQSDTVVCAIVDCEATSADPKTAHPIELGIVKAAFSPGSAASIQPLDYLSMLNDPGVPSEPSALAVHGITLEDIAGKSFNRSAIASFLDGVDFVIAHNASYDRPVLSRHIESLASLPWACSLKELPWGQLGMSSRSLDYLLYRTGYFHTGHRAVNDCLALLKVLSHPFQDGDPPLFELNRSRQQNNWVILCERAPYATKDLMHERGYRWNPGDGQIPLKLWSTPEINGDELMLKELEWLRNNIYSDQDATVSTIPCNASIRYASDQGMRSFEGRRTFRIDAAIDRLRNKLGTSETAVASAPVPRA